MIAKPDQSYRLTGRSLSTVVQEAAKLDHENNSNALWTKKNQGRSVAHFKFFHLILPIDTATKKLNFVLNEFRYF